MVHHRRERTVWLLRYHCARTVDTRSVSAGDTLSAAVGILKNNAAISYLRALGRQQLLCSR